MVKGLHILKIQITNWKGAHGTVEYAFNKQGNVINGINEAGKTTIVNAICWVISGKDIYGRKDYEIRNRFLPIEVESTVTMWCVTDSGQELKLKRTVKAVYEGKANNKQYTSDTTEFEIDDLPIKTLKAYDERISEEFFNSKKIDMNIIFNLRFIAEEMENKDKRKLLKNLFAKTTEEEFINSNPKFKELIKLKDKHDVADWRKINETNLKRLQADIKEKQKEINKEAQQIQLTKAEREVDTKEKIRIELEIETLEAENQDFLKQISNIENNVEKIILKADLARFKADLQTLENRNVKHKQDAEKLQSGDTDEKLSKLLDEMTKLKMLLTDKENQLSKNKNEMEIIIDNGKKETELSEKITASKWGGNEICPTCEQLIPKDKIQSAKEAFNLDKSQKLEAIQANGKELNVKYKALQITNKELQDEIEKITKDEADSKQEYTTIKAKKSEAKPIKDIQDYATSKQTIEGFIVKAEAKITAIDTDSQATIDCLQVKTDDIAKELKNVRGKIEDINVNIKIDESVKRDFKKLQAEQSVKVEESDKLSYNINLCNDYINEEADLLSEEIKPYFDKVEWRLIDRYKNGNPNSNCLLLVDGVPYGTTNTGNKYLAQLDINNAIQKRLGLNTPVLFDNAESLTKEIPIVEGRQVFVLKVSPYDSKLKIRSFDEQKVFDEMVKKLVLENKKER